MNPDRITLAQRGDAAAVAATIAEAFQHLDVAAWLVPDAPQRREVLYRNMLIWTSHALGRGKGAVYTIGRGPELFDAVGVWFPEPSENDPPDYPHTLKTACGRYTGAFLALDAAFTEHHPHDQVHHHLAFLAVVPSRQGEGLGTALMQRHRHDHPDMPCYLEASSPRARRLYLDQGYRDHPGPFTLPDGPSLWPMWRDPAT